MTTTEMAELGLNVFQVIQNELISREGSRSSLGLGFRLSVLEERMMNIEAANRNSKVWKLHHHISPIAALTPEARDQLEKQRKQLLDRKGAKKMSDDKDPTMHTRKEERWEIHTAFPRTLLDFKELQYHRTWSPCSYAWASVYQRTNSFCRELTAERVRSLVEFYDVKVYRHDFKLIDIDPDDRCRDVASNIETCLEELAMQWGINWQRIGGLSMPYPPTPITSSSSQFTPAHTPASSQFSTASNSGRFTPVQQRSTPPPFGTPPSHHTPPAAPMPPDHREI